MDTHRNLKFTNTHEWVEGEKEITVGITDFAQEQLGELTFVELPSVGDTVSAQDEIGVVESVKAASDVYAPVSGTITEVNDQLQDRPELINSDPLGEGWLYKMKPDDPAELDQLMSADEYEESLPHDD
jgi:glycine cleavage system H protein